MSKLRAYIEEEYRKELERLIEGGSPPLGICREELVPHWFKDQALSTITEYPNDFGTHLYDLYVQEGGEHYELLIYVDKHLDSFFTFVERLEWHDLSDYCSEHELMGWFL